MPNQNSGENEAKSQNGASDSQIATGENNQNGAQTNQDQAAQSPAPSQNAASAQNPAPSQSPDAATLARAQPYGILATALMVIFFTFILLYTVLPDHDLIGFATFALVPVVFPCHALLGALAFGKLGRLLGWEFGIANLVCFAYSIAFVLTVDWPTSSFEETVVKVLQICSFIAFAAILHVLWRASRLTRNPLFLLTAILMITTILIMVFSYFVKFDFDYSFLPLSCAVLAHFLAWIFLMKFAQEKQI